MNSHMAAAIFHDHDQAERAISELRRAGVPDAAISVISLHQGQATTTDGSGHTTANHDHGDNKATGIMKGLTTGGAVGALAGLAALAIPGVGPFIAAGALAETLGAVGSAAVVSGAVGAAAGGLTGALVDYGFDRGHAEHYERRIREGGIFVGVDTSSSPGDFDAVRSVLRAAGGEMAESKGTASV